MRVIVFGATGATGLAVVEQGLAAGHAVTAFARTPERIPQPLRDKIAIAQGDVTDLAAVTAALRDHGVVVSCLGTRPWKHVDICSSGTRVISAAMASAGLRRLIIMSSLGVGDSQIAGLEGKIAGWLLGKSFRDKGVMETELAATALDWIAVRPARLTNGAAKGTWRAADDGSVTTGKISRADTAAFMLGQVSSDEWLRRRPALAW